MIGFYNVQNSLRDRFADKYKNIFIFNETQPPDNFPDLDALLIDWAKRTKNLTPKFIAQGAIVDYYARKKIPIVIYDRYMSVIFGEYNWLNKYGVSFFEPAINNRKGFEYLPQWIEIPEIEWEEKKRDTHLLYKGSLAKKFLSFENYYVSVASQYPKFNVVLDSRLDKSKEKEYIDYNIKLQSDKFSNSQWTIAIGSKRDYEVGYMDPMAMKALEEGCTLLIPKEHRYYYSIFKQGVIENVGEINFIISSFTDGIRFGVLQDIFQNIRNFHPEFDVNYTFEAIDNELEHK